MYVHLYASIYVRRVWRYHRGNQKPYIEQGQTTQWLKEMGQNTTQITKKIEHHEPHSKLKVKSGAPVGGGSVPAQLVAPVVLL